MPNASRGGQLAKLISDEDRQIYEVVAFVFFTFGIAFFGVVTNILNIIIFVKQGFANTVNISFFALAIADMLGLVGMLWTCMCCNPLFIYSDIPMYVPEIQYVTGAVPHFCFARITSFITVYITVERCLCIMIPLKIKTLITRRKTTINLSIIYCLVAASFIPDMATTYIDWAFFPSRNRSLLTLAYTKDRHRVEGLTFFFYTFLGLFSFLAVVFFTILLVVQLKRKSQWRMKASGDKSTSENISNKERKTVIMVAMIATILIICYTPGCAVSITTFIVPAFSVAGQIRNAYFVCWGFAYILESVNSSVNIFLYYRMSTKYRETFRQLFGVSDN